MGSRLKNGFLSNARNSSVVLILVFVLAALILGFQPSSVQAESSVAKMKSREEEIRLTMISWSDQLGVTCNECHNVNNFKDSSKKKFQVSLDHAKVVEMLRQNGFDGKKYKEANCTTCHMGQIKPPVTVSKKK
ncbi:MAG: multiheme c-type cytochrome [Bdellovibrionota bacterium]